MIKEKDNDICKIYNVNYEQSKALDTNMNIALKAGAGSGKTRVLTKRFIKTLIDNPDYDLSNIVAITFTKKAATEMKDRIRKELNSKIDNTNDEAQKERLLNIKMQITNSNIDTIHGFCKKLIQDNFVFLGIDPRFKIIEEVDKNVLISKIMDRIINKFLSNNENKKIIDIIAEKFSAKFFMTSFKEGIIKSYVTIREKAMYIGKCFVNNGFDGKDINKIVEKITCDMLHQLDKKYREYKEDENVFDFNDLEFQAEKLLKNENIRDEYYKRYRVIMVDEFQDINDFQRKIINNLVFKANEIPPGKLFIVGDHKQSIYGFRGSDYRVFEEVCSRVSDYGRVNYLSNCYRSTENIINTVNNIFKQLLEPYEDLKFPGKSVVDEKKVDFVTYDSSKKDKKASSRWDLTKKMLVMNKSKEQFRALLDAKYESNNKENQKCYQGELIAGIIKRLASEGFEYKDIAILLRNRNSLSDIENELGNRSIPYCVLGGIGFWNRSEVNDILLLYKLIFYPEDKLTLFSVLRSPIFGFSDDLIYSFSVHMKYNEKINPKNLMYTFYMEFEPENRILKRASEIFSKIFQLNGILNAVDVFDKIIKLTGYDEILTILPKGEKKVRNLEKLIDMVEKFESKGIYNARDLIGYLDILKESGGMDSDAFLDSEDSHAVKILTIHASKGLEFKAVLIPDMHKPLDSKIKRDKPLFLFDDNGKLTSIGIDSDGKINIKENPVYEKLFNKKIERELADSRRLFYVAATRAMDYLCFIGESQKVDYGKDINMQNTFMKQLLWALNRTGDMAEMQAVHPDDFLVEEDASKPVIPDYIKRMKEISMCKAQNHSELFKKGNFKSCSEGFVSISAWMKFRDCPRRFYLENIAGLREFNTSKDDYEGIDNGTSTMNAAEFGTFVHAFLENSDISNLDILKHDLSDIGEELSNTDKKLFENSIDGFIKIEEEKRKSTYKGTLYKSINEFAFSIPLIDGLDLIGFIDRLDVYEKDGVYNSYIIDYKTNQVKTHEDILKKTNYYESQLLCYSWALNKLPFLNGQKAKVKEAMLYFLYNGECSNIKLDENNMEKVVESLINDFSWLLGSKPLNEYKCNKTTKCNYCECKNYCASLLE